MNNNENINDTPKLAPPKKASKILGLSEYSIRERIRQNKIPYVKSGNKNYILIDSFLKQLEEESKTNI